MDDKDRELNAWRELGEEMGRVISLMPSETFADWFPDWFGPRLFDLQVKAAPALRGEASPPQEPCGDCGQPILEGQEIATVCPGDAPTYRVHKRCGKRATAHGRIAARVVSEDSK